MAHHPVCTLRDLDEIVEGMDVPVRCPAVWAFKPGSFNQSRCNFPIQAGQVDVQANADDVSLVVGG